MRRAKFWEKAAFGGTSGNNEQYEPCTCSALKIVLELSDKAATNETQKFAIQFRVNPYYLLRKWDIKCCRRKSAMFKGAPLPTLKMLYFLGLIYNEIKVLPKKL